MIPDRIIEKNTLIADETRSEVEVRIPWYRALPASCIAGAGLRIDGCQAPAESLRWTMNGQTFTMTELAELVNEWWNPLDSVVLSGEIPLEGTDDEHEVRVDLSLFIPYIETEDMGTLRIEEHDTKTMRAGRR